MFFRSVEENAAATATVTRQNVAVTRHKKILMPLSPLNFSSTAIPSEEGCVKTRTQAQMPGAVRLSGIVFLATYLSSLAFASGSPLPPTLPNWRLRFLSQ